MKLKSVSRTQLVGAWVAAVTVLMAISVVAGASLTTGAGELWLAAAVVPPAIMWLLWRGAPPVTVAELLHTVDGQVKEGRR
jgi:hypothetical protein